jgi:hypothetical protein
MGEEFGCRSAQRIDEGFKSLKANAMMPSSDPMRIEIAGLGIMIYSPENDHHIDKGEDYFSTHYQEERDVQKHIQAGSIVGFGTGSPGSYLLQFHEGYPNEEFADRCEFVYRLGLRCVGGEVYIRDLYDLMDWDPECPREQRLELPSGIYHVTLCSSTPESGILGEDQTIDIYLQPLAEFPNLAKEGIPHLTPMDEE